MDMKKNKGNSTNETNEAVTKTEGYLCDEVFRILITDYQKSVIPLINELFQKSYDLGSPIEINTNECFDTTQDRNQDIKIIDCDVSLAGDLYQIKYQHVADGNITLHIYEHWSQMIQRNKLFDDSKDTLYMKFPQIVILYLLNNEKIPNFTNINIHLPGISHEYKIPNLKLSRHYCKQDLFDKKLYFLMPFYLLFYEEIFKHHNNNGSLKEPKQENK